MKNKIDWGLLRDQKESLISKSMVSGEFDGIINFIDAIQDFAVDVVCVPENTVFGEDLEQEDDYSTGVSFEVGQVIENGDTWTVFRERSLKDCFDYVKANIDKDLFIDAWEDDEYVCEVLGC